MSRLDKVLTVDEMKACARRRVPKQFFDYADSGSWTESTYRANRADFEKILLRQRIAKIARRPKPGDRHRRTGRRHAGRAFADRPHGDAMRGRRDQGGQGRGKGRSSLHALDDVDLLDRGCRGELRPAVLVSALRHERSQIHREAHRSGQGGQMPGAGADDGSADSRTAPQGHSQRPVSAAEIHSALPLRDCAKAAMGFRNAGDEAAQLRQHRRARR